MEEVKALLRQVIKNQNEIAGVRDVEYAAKWDHGTVVFKPGDPNLKSYELPIDVFLKKIISVREKLRVLEQKINNHPKLSDGEKVELEQYLSRCYGSLTSFNILFKHDADKFHGQ